MNIYHTFTIVAGKATHGIGMCQAHASTFCEEFLSSQMQAWSGVCANEYSQAYYMCIAGLTWWPDIFISDFMITMNQTTIISNFKNIKIKVKRSEVITSVHAQQSAWARCVTSVMYIQYSGLTCVIKDVFHQFAHTYFVTRAWKERKTKFSTKGGAFLKIVRLFAASILTIHYVYNLYKPWVTAYETTEINTKKGKQAMAIMAIDTSYFYLRKGFKDRYLLGSILL